VFLGCAGSLATTQYCQTAKRADQQEAATRAIGDWISFYNHRHPHQALDMKTPAEAFELAA
jgi:putative transposase